MTSALVIGQSHCAAIAQAVFNRCEGAGNLSVYRLADSKRPFERDTISIEDAVAIVTELSDDTRIFVSVLGTYHNILALLRSGPLFDVLLDADDVLEEASVCVPHRAIASAFEQTFTEAKTIRKIRSAARSSLYLLSSPPPKQSNEFILECLLRQKKQSYRGRTIAELGVERPISRLKLWQLEARLLASWAKNEGMHFVPPPQAAFDDQGFLRQDLYQNDATHANSRYGVLIVEQISRILMQERQEAVNG